MGLARSGVQVARRMRVRTVLVVLLLITVGTAKDGKWERVTLGSLTKRGSLLVKLLLHCSTECDSI